MQTGSHIGAGTTYTSAMSSRSLFVVGTGEPLTVYSSQAGTAYQITQEPVLSTGLGWQVKAWMNPAAGLRIREALRQLDEIQRLPHDWDTYRSESPSAQAVSTAREIIWEAFIESSGASGLPFALAPLSGRGLQLEWRGPDGALEVEVGADGALGYLLVRGEGPDREFQEQDGVPREQVLQLIRSVIS